MTKRESRSLYSGYLKPHLFRITGGFGNTHPVQGSGIMAFLAVNKYPPSLAYMLLFSGVNLLVISAFSRAGHFWARKDDPLQVFGKCPFFFYILHLFFFLAVGKLFPAPPGYWGGYACWAAGLAVLYWPCRSSSVTFPNFAPFVVLSCGKTQEITKGVSTLCSALSRWTL
ncbi:MAG TPA: hypothetical protein PLH45_05045 [Synergistales bacterium]|nr:hypothetical protein [Synergistales bacterium]